MCYLAQKKYRMKIHHNALYLLILFVVFQSCTDVSTSEKVQLKSISGKTMGTTYSVKYLSDKIITKNEIDSLFYLYNQSVSTYIPDSYVSLFNTASDSVFFPNGSLTTIFEDNFLLARKVYEESNGLFDPTVMPLVNYYGFGFKGHEAPAQIDSSKIDSILQLVGFDKIEMILSDSGMIIKKKFPEMQLDFSASAKGLGVDYIGDYLDTKEITNYLVEIGGECLAKGNKGEGKPWVSGISVPAYGSETDEYVHAIQLENKGIATSGNYRNFRKTSGRTIGHTIHPKTGYPFQSEILSATILSESCGEADAWATTLLLKTKAELDSFKETSKIDFLYIYATGDSLKSDYTTGFQKYILN